MEKFWMVIGENANSTSIRHDKIVDAIKEAERLSSKEGKRFYVLEAVAYCEIERVPVKWTNL